MFKRGRRRRDPPEQADQALQRRRRWPEITARADQYLSQFSLPWRRQDRQHSEASDTIIPESLQTVQKYQYTALDENSSQIRLLTLLPGTFSSEIRLCLDITHLTEDHIPKYEAVSYAWGSAENLVDIFIGESGQETLAVTQNLAQALPYFQYEDKPRILWIDAICIDQENLEERGQQVQRMADIYSNAAKVLVWLGPESRNSDLAIDFVKSVASKFEFNPATNNLTALTDEVHWADPYADIPLEETEYLAIVDFINRPWFERLWAPGNPEFSGEPRTPQRSSKLDTGFVITTAFCSLDLGNTVTTRHSLQLKLDDTILKVEGVIVDKIEEIMSLDSFDLGFDVEEISNKLKEFALKIGFQAPFPKGPLLEALSRTVCANLFASRFLPPVNEYPTVEECEETICELLGDNVSHLKVLHKANAALRIIQWAFKGQSLYTTIKGTLGLGPRASRPGDVVTSLLGRRSAIVLRPTNDGKYEVIGEAYCDGFMDDEALLGPLPNSCRGVWRHTENIGWTWVILNQRTGVFEAEDPRLGPLPPNWKTEGTMEEGNQMFVNGETGKSTEEDPRMTSEALRARGVPIQVFELV